MELTMTRSTFRNAGTYRAVVAMNAVLRLESKTAHELGAKEHRDLLGKAQDVMPLLGEARGGPNGEDFRWWQDYGGGR
jgi:hypothetical protein